MPQNQFFPFDDTQNVAGAQGNYQQPAGAPSSATMNNNSQQAIVSKPQKFSPETIAPFKDPAYKKKIIDNNPYFKPKVDARTASTGLDGMINKLNSSSYSQNSKDDAFDLKSRAGIVGNFDVNKDREKIMGYVSESMRQGRDTETKGRIVAPSLEPKKDFFILEHDMRYIAKNDTYDGYYEDVLPIDQKKVERDQKNRAGTLRLIFISAIVVIIFLVALLFGRVLIDFYVNGGY